MLAPTEGGKGGGYVAETAVGHTLLWNYEEVLEVLRAAGNVAATFAGHAHQASAQALSSCACTLVNWLAGDFRALHSETRWILQSAF